MDLTAPDRKVSMERLLHCIRRLALPTTICVGLALSGCMDSGLGIEGGASALQAQFSGIQTATVLSPTSIQVTWALNPGYSSYNVYISTQDAPIATNVVFNSYKITGLNSNTSYSLSVAGVAPDGSINGISKQITVQTWAPFTGPTSATVVDSSDINLSWNYQNGPSYDIYYKTAPFGQAAPTFSPADLTGSPNMVSQSPTGTTVGGLLPNTVYSFAIVAIYPDGTSSYSNGVQGSSVSAMLITAGSPPIATMPAIAATSPIAANTKASFSVSGAAATYVSSFYTGTLNNAASCPTVPAGNLLASISGNGNANSTTALSAGSYYVNVQVKDTLTGYCGYEAVTVTSSAANSIVSVNATTPSGLSPLPIVTVNPIQLGGLPTFTVAGAKATYTTQILYNGSVIASLTGNGTMTTLSTNPLPLGFNSVTPFVSAGGQSAYLSPLTVQVKGIDTTQPIHGPTKFNGGISTSPGLGATVVVGDFNCDGYPDLAVGAPLGPFAAPTSYNGNLSNGGVAVYYGTSTGLDFSATPSTAPTGTKPLFIPSPSTQVWTGGDYFGNSMAAGNINGGSVSGKPCSDLVVSSWANQGFYVYYGSQTGLQVTTPYTINNIGCNASGSCQTSDFSIANTPDALLIDSYSNPYPQPIAVAVGDFNGDGYDDVAMSLSYAYDAKLALPTTPPTATNTGEIFLFMGSQYGLSPNYQKFFPPQSMMTNSLAVHFGRALAFGNVQYKPSGVCTNGKCKDLIVSMDGYVGSSTYGGVIVVQGNSLGEVYVDTTTYPNHLNANYLAISPPQCGASSGCGVPIATADINQDGYDDILFGADGYVPAPPYNYSYSGGMFVFYGNPAGPPVISPVSVNSGGAPCSVAQNGTSCVPQLIYRTVDDANSLFFGYSIASLGDTNGDGYPEIAVGAPGYGGSQKGAAYVYYGSGYGLSGTAALANTNPASNAIFGMGLAGAKFNSPTFASQFPSGTVSGQFHDFAVGAPGETLTGQGNPGQGVVHFFANSGSGFGSSITADTSQAPSVTPLAKTEAERFENARFVGDVNGDGYSDIVAPLAFSGTMTLNGSYKLTAGTRFGFVMYYGSASGLITSPEPEYAPINPTDPLLVTDANYGLNDYTLGWSLAGGDFNGDGYADVVASGNNTYVFYGSSTGLQTQVTPLTSPISPLNPRIISQGSNNAATSGFDPSQITTGDFNGDGYADIAIAQNISIQNGHFVFIIYGSASGVVTGSNPAGTIVAPNVSPVGAQNSASWQPQVLSGTWPNAQMNPLGIYTCTSDMAFNFGTTCNVTGASNGVPFVMGRPTYDYSSYILPADTGPMRILAVGDTDHDGTDDLVMIDSADSNFAGAIYIFYGSVANGIVPSQWARLRITPTFQGGGSVYPGTYIPDSGGQPREMGRYGWYQYQNGGSLSRAYDVNGDGVADFVVGAERETNGTTTQFKQGGAAYLIYGINGGWASLGPSVCFPESSYGNTSGAGYPCTVTIGLWSSAAQNYQPNFVITNSNTSCNPSTNMCNVLRFFPNQMEASNGWFARGVLGVRDITGDGFADIAVAQQSGGAGGTNPLFIFSGSTNGLQVASKPANNPNCSSGSCAPYFLSLPNDPTAQSLGVNMQYLVNGWAGTGDVDHDGYPDIAVSSSLVSDPSGQGIWNGGFYLFH